MRLIQVFQKKTANSWSVTSKSFVQPRVVHQYYPHLRTKLLSKAVFCTTFSTLFIRGFRGFMYVESSLLDKIYWSLIKYLI